MTNHLLEKDSLQWYLQIILLEQSDSVHGVLPQIRGNYLYLNRFPPLNLHVTS
jgi:hypothetical protein